MGKKTFKNYLVSATAVWLLMVFLLMFTYTRMVNAKPAEAMWIEPSELSFYTNTTYVGQKFNVTLWVNLTVDSYSWQFHLEFNTTQLNATRSAYTAGTPPGSMSDWATHRTGGTTVPVVPNIDNVVGFVEYGESCSGAYYVPGPVVGSLAWVEFEILTEPMEGTLTSQFDIDNIDTFFLNFDLDDILFTKYFANYSYTFAPDTTSPTIGTPVQNPPAGNVQPDQNVTVSVNVTDTESGVKNVTLLYTNDTIWHSIPMTLNETSGLWEGIIPGETQDTLVEYKILAYDNAENMEENDNAGEYFIYTVIPEFTSLMLFTLMTILTIVVVAVRKKFKS